LRTGSALATTVGTNYAFPEGLVARLVDEVVGTCG
jgi:hypothetical protein